MGVLLKRMFAVIVVITLLFVVSCTRNVKEMKLVNENATFDLVIAGDSSEYKDSIREELISKYKERATIEVVNIEDLEIITEDSYDVILIMDTCMAWGAFNPSVNNYLDEATRKDNIVLFMTADDVEWEYSYQNVDAITSASEIENKDEVITSLSERIDNVISNL
jgi:hypothetical protein